MARKTEEIEKLEEVENMEIEEAKKIKQEDAEKIKQEKLEKKMNEELEKINQMFARIVFKKPQRLQELDEQKRMLMSTPAFDLRELARSMNVAWPDREE